MPSKPPKGLPEALTRALTGRRGEQSIADAVRAAEKRAGSQKALAREWGVTPRTLQRWKAGEGRERQKPTREHRGAIRAAERETIDPTRYQRAEATGKGQGGIILDATVRISGDERRRELDLGKNLPAGFLAAALRAYRNGDDDGAARALEGALNDRETGYTNSGQPVHIQEIHGITLR